MFQFNVGDQVRVKTGLGLEWSGTIGTVIKQIPRGSLLTPAARFYEIELVGGRPKSYSETDLELVAVKFPETLPEEAPPAPDPMRQPASDTATKLRRWMELETEVNQLKDRLQKAQRELDEAVQDLGAHLCPPNAKVDEDFHIWVGDSMVRAKIANLSQLNPQNTRYIVVPHYKGKNWGKW